jgi:anti-anti-sigma factor
LEPDLWLVEAQGRLDQALSPQLQTALDQLLAEGHANIIVDLSKTTYVNSGGLRCLLTGRRRSRSQGGDVIICGLDARLAEVFAMVGFDQVFTIYDTLEAARKHVFA